MNSDGAVYWASVDVALPAGATAHRVVNLTAGEYVVRLTVSNAGSESSLYQTEPVSAKFSSEDDSSDNTGLVAGLVICILVILAMGLAGIILFRWHRCGIFFNSQAKHDYFTTDPCNAHSHCCLLACYCRKRQKKQQKKDEAGQEPKTDSTLSMKSPVETEYELIDPAFNGTQMVERFTTNGGTPDANISAELRYANGGVTPPTATQESPYEQPHVSRVRDTDKDYEILLSVGM